MTHSFLDRIAARVRLIKNLEVIEDTKAVVRAMTVVLWGGIVQVLLAGAILLFFAEPIVAHAGLGGYAYSGGSLFFGITLTAAVALLLGKRAVLIASFTYGAAAVVFGFLEETLRASRPAPDPTLTTFLFVFTLISNLAVVPPLMVYLMGKVRAERGRAESLLSNMLPAEVAAELKREGSTTPRRFDSMSVLFADIVGFTPLSSEMTPRGRCRQPEHGLHSLRWARRQAWSGEDPHHRRQLHGCRRGAGQP